MLALIQTVRDAAVSDNCWLADTIDVFPIDLANVVFSLARLACAFTDEIRSEGVVDEK